MRRRVPPEERALEELRLLKNQSKPPPNEKKRARWPRYIAAAVLAAVCIGGAELAACRFFEPALYETIMEPVREAAHQTVQAAGRGLEALGRGAAFLAERAGEAASSAGTALRDWIADISIPPPKPEAEPEGDSVLAQPEVAPPKEMLDPIITDIIERDGQEILVGGGLDIFYFNQTDEARKDQRYGSDLLATHGCGPTAMAMAVSSLTEEAVDPEEMAALCVKRGYWCKNHGSYLSIVQGISEEYGLACESVNLEDLEEDSLYLRLAGGDVAVALMTKGHFTKGGHFILLRGTTLSGEILVADPASRDRSLIPWDLSLILGELSPSRHDGAPLWILSRPEE